MSLNPKGQAVPETAQGIDSPEESDTPKHMTVEEFNRAFSSMKKTLERQYEQRFTKLIEDRFAQSQPPQSMQATGNQEPGNTNPTNPNPPIRVEDSPAYRESRRELEELKKGLASVQAERDAERQKGLALTKRNLVQERLQAAGITGAALKLATNEVLASTSYDEESQQYVYGTGAEALPFDSGVKTWLKSDEAKVLMPARGVAGSGAVPGGAQAQRPGMQSTPVNPMQEFLVNAGLIPSSE
jgi:hypothetical protein